MTLKAILDTKSIQNRYARTQKEFISVVEEHLYWEASRDFRTYIKLIFNSDKKDGEEYSFDDYHEVLLDEIWNWVFGNDVNNLMILLPPRGGKSELGSVLLPSWLAGVMSESVLNYGFKSPFEIIQSCYSDALLRQFYQKQISYIETPTWSKIFPGIKLAPAMGQRYGSQFSRTGSQMDFVSDVDSPFGVFREKGGNYKKSAVTQLVPYGGAITGKGANVIIMDDMIKDDVSADSANQRDKLWSWYQATLYTRAEDKHGASAKFLALNTRWHESDLTARLEDSGEWKVIRLPAFAYPEGNKLRHHRDNRKTDEVLSKRMAGTYNRVRNSWGKDSRRFVTLYQQISVPLEGNIIKGSDIQLYTEKPEQIDLMVMGIDLAFKGNKKEIEEAAKKELSYSVFEIWGINQFENKYYLLDQRRGQFRYPEQKSTLLEFVDTYDDLHEVILEEAANADAMQAELEDEILNLKLWKPKTDKALRLRLVEHLYKQKKVYYPDPTIWSWSQKNIEEITKFPAYKTKDTVDVASMTLFHLKDYMLDSKRLEKLSAW